MLSGCTCTERECPNEEMTAYHHYANGCLDCDCEALGPQRFQDPPERDRTVDRIDLWGNRTGTFQTEAELAGLRASQARLF